MSVAAPRRFLSVCLLLLAAPWLGADPGTPAEFAVKAWETDDGLPHNSVNAVIQARDGFLWVATLGGAARFDGTVFVRLDSPLVHGVKSSNVVSLIEENADALVLLGNQSGLVRVRHGEATPHPLNAELGAKTRAVLLGREADDVFWVFTGDRGLLRSDHGRVERFAPPASARGPIAPGFAVDQAGAVYIARGAGVERYQAGTLVPSDESLAGPVTLAAARDGGIWIATARELVRWKAGKLSRLQVPQAWSATQPPTVLFEDCHHALWVGAPEQGLLRWQDGRTEVVATSHAKITALCEDREGNLWAATAGGGLDRIQRKRLSLIAEEPDWTDSITASICEGPNGDMWFANLNGIRKIRPDRQVELVSGDPGWPKRAVPVVADRRGNMWYALGSGIFCVGGEPGAPARLVEKTPLDTHVLYPARDGSVWVGGAGRVLERIAPNGKISRFNSHSGYGGHHVRAITEDAQGHVWVGTNEGRLFEAIGGKFGERTSVLGLAGYPIRVLHGDAEGRLWIGTVGAGVLLVEGGHQRAIGPAQGLPDDVISQLLEDDFGWLWFGCQRGIFKARKADLAACAAGRVSRIVPVMFGRADGLSGISAIGSYQPTAWKSRSGELWFVTRKGVIRVNPDPHELDPGLLRVYLDAFVVDGQPVEVPRESGADEAPGAWPRFASSARRVEFHFTAPTFTAPERVRFRYQLAGFDRDWVEGGAQRSATYSGLAPGRYHFRVNVSGVDGTWAPAMAAMSFEVTPMWWETWWARAVAVAAFAAFVVAAARFWSHRRLRARLARLEQEQRVERERKRIARDLHDDLGASLTHVSMMADELTHDWQALPDPRASTVELAERVRHIARDLDAVVWTASPQNDTLDALAAYLSHFAEEYFRHAPVECRVQVPDDLPATPLAPEARHHLFLIAKELLNNVLKHAEARKVEVVMRLAGDVFELVVADDGRGFSVAQAEASGRNGLGNLRARAGEIGGVLDIATSAAGTQVTLRFPLGGAGVAG